MQNGSSELAWTKGLVLNRRRETAPAYRIVNRDGRDYLILEWKSGDYSFGGLLRWYIFTRA